MNFKDSVDGYKKLLITQALEACNHNISRTAFTLGVHRNALSRMMDKLNIERPRKQKQ